VHSSTATTGTGGSDSPSSPPFLLPNEVGNLYARQGRPVPAVTGLWMLLGSFILIGPLVWLIKTNGAHNAYWRSLGVA
jgi:hypothetical protein